LAGAAEELLGKLLEKEGGASRLKTLINECVSVGHNVHGDDWPTKFSKKRLKTHWRWQLCRSI